MIYLIITLYNYTNIPRLVIASSSVSGLEAFSHNRTDGSFAPLAYRPSAIANYPIQRFLSYYVELLLQ